MLDETKLTPEPKASEPERTLEVRDLGPIAHFRCRAPLAGVIVLKGPMGAGKSLIIGAIESAATGRGKPPVRDGAERGEIGLGDVLLRVGKQARRTGEPDFEVLPGRYQITDLIAPPYKSVEACDEHAIKTLAQLGGGAAGTAGDESLFYDLCGGKEAFEKLCPARKTGSTDVVALAAEVERGLQGRARDEENQATVAESKADAYTASARGIDLTADADGSKLQDVLHKALVASGAVKQRATDAQQKIEAAAQAQESLEDATAELEGISVIEAERAFTHASGLALPIQDDVDDMMLRIEALKNSLVAKQHALELAKTEVVRTKQALAAARTAENLLERFRATVAAGQWVEPVPESELTAARTALDAAAAAVERGALVRKAVEDRRIGEEWRKKARQHCTVADALRGCAAGVDEILSGLVGKLGSQLFVKRGKLLLKTDRGEESFWELSDGERSEIAVTIFANAVGPDGLLALPQSFWEGLAWEGRVRIAEHLKRVGVLAWTAESDKTEAETGPLRAEVFEP